ncbi:hypothetical protein KJZ99_11225 [bacterium]|nr:hypothetical protein [bacterium]
MTNEFALLITATVTVGVAHSLVGPDHYVPFVALARARRWSMQKALTLTALCGVAHVLGSLIIAVLGLHVGIHFLDLRVSEALRGDFAAWLLLAFGLVYAIWGLRHALSCSCKQDFGCGDSIVRSLLLIVLILGPCEPLIPIVLMPAVSLGPTTLAAVSIVFLLSTVLTMMATVALGYKGLRLLLKLDLGRYGHAFAGGSIASCAAAVLFLGL